MKFLREIRLPTYYNRRKYLNLNRHCEFITQASIVETKLFMFSFAFQFDVIETKLIANDFRTLYPSIYIAPPAFRFPLLTLTAEIFIRMKMILIQTEIFRLTTRRLSEYVARMFSLSCKFGVEHLFRSEVISRSDWRSVSKIYN